MTEHLRDEEMIDALDEPLAAPRQAHLDACDACQAEMTSLRGVVREARAVEIDEPSPLFWDHFSERVRQATSREPLPRAEAWWHAWWRPVGVLAAAAGAVLLVAVMRPSPNELPASVSSEQSPVTSLALASDDGSWGLVIGLASELDATDVREAARPAEGTADAMIDELTPAQRSALAKLLQEGMGELQ
jgi:hypothetical protein